jgi:hypothetical protein
MDEFVDNPRSTAVPAADGSPPSTSLEDYGKRRSIRFLLPHDGSPLRTDGLRPSLQDYGKSRGVRFLYHPRTTVLTDSLQLATNESSAKYASIAMLFCVFCSIISQASCDGANIPMMVSPQHPQSFPSTEPFGFASAQYVLLGAKKVGVVISNLIFGYLSGNIGCRMSLLILMLGQAVFTLALYFARSSFWAYTAMGLVNGGLIMFLHSEMSHCLVCSPFFVRLA